MLLLTFILLICNLSLIHSISFMELPFKLDKGNRIIHAALTDKATGKVWNIEEKISSADLIEGKIDVKYSDTTTNIQANVFYSFKPGYDNNKRLVMHDNNCEMYIFKTDWDKQFPGVTNTLTNMVLLMGPSFFYRITDSNWLPGNDQNVRGAIMHSASFVLGQKLKVTAYYKSPDNVAIGVTQPNRILLTGYDPSGPVDQEETGETLILDIYLQSVTSEQLAESVQPTPGIGCSTYLQDDIETPTSSVDKIHFIARDIVNQTSITLKEVHADEYKQTLRLTETKNTFTTNYLYDYNLGVGYQLSTSGACSLKPIDLKTIGVDSNGKFGLTALLWMEGTFHYLGQVIFEHRSGFKTKVWESIHLDKVHQGVKYDKVVTTLYMSPSTTEGTFSGYMLVAVARNAYTKDTSGNYALIESIHRDFYDFDIDLPESEYEEAFALGDCYSDSTKRLTLTMHITCNSGKKSNCLEKGEDMSSELREKLIDKMDQVYGLSSLRIVDVEFVFTRERIEADVTIVEAPTLKESFSYEYRQINTTAIKKLHETTMKSDEECLKFQSSYSSSGSAVVFCQGGNVCVSTESLDSIVESNPTSSGTDCYIFNTPLKNLNRFGQEKSLEDIHDHLLKEIVHDTFNLKERSGDTYTYEIADIVATNKLAEEESRALFGILNARARLAVDGKNVIEIADVKRYSDCYRACSKSEDIFCETFSFCEADDSTTCIVSSLSEKQVDGILTSDGSCKSYSKNHITDYTARAHKSYKVPISVSTSVWVDECAAECANSPDCFSFEYCSGLLCTLGGYYSESSTQFSSDCTIYTPKLSEKYELTGSNVVTEVLHTEVDLDLDQCAVFCYDYKQGDHDACRSFNYCPKGEKQASCQLTKHSVKDAKTVTSESTNCHNYELKTAVHNVNQDNQLTLSQSVRTTGGGAFGIIMLFLFIGLIAGFAGPYAVIKIKSYVMYRGSSNNFAWSRQIDVNNADEYQSEIQI